MDYMNCLLQHHFIPSVFQDGPSERDGIRKTNVTAATTSHFDSPPRLTYSELTREASACLAFPLPTSGLSLGYGRHITSHAASAYALRGIGSRKGGLERSVAYSYCTLDCPAEDGASPPRISPAALIHASFTADSGERGDIFKPSLEARKVRHDPFKRKSDYWIYGRMFQDFRLEGALATTLNSRGTMFASVTGTSGLNPSNDCSYAAMQFIHFRPSCTYELTYTTDKHVFGGSWLASLPKDFAMGGELFYMAAERSGGLSIGLRYTPPFLFQSSSSTLPCVRPVFTCISNPIMGHVLFSYASTVYPNLRVATQYEVNVHSLESDVSFGVKWRPSHSENNILHARVSLLRGVYLRLDGVLGEDLGTFSAGLGMRLFPCILESSGGGKGAKGETGQPPPLVGLEINLF